MNDVELSWRDFDAWRAERDSTNPSTEYAHIRAALSSITQGYPRCDLCDDDHTVVICSRDGHTVCIACGTVLDSFLYAVPSKMPTTHTRVLYNTYKAIFHWNERIAQLNCFDPWIPHAVWLDIQRAWLVYGDLVMDPTTGDVGREGVATLLGFVKKRPGAPLRCYSKHSGKIRKKYMERWISLRYRCTGFRPKPMSGKLIHALETRVKRVFCSWAFVRHHDECPGAQGMSHGFKCHKIVRSDGKRCRHNNANFNFMFQQFFKDIAAKMPNLFGNVAQEYCKYVETIKTPARLENLKLKWIALFPYTDIPLYP